MTNKIRTHDKFYINEKDLPPKDIFKKIGDFFKEDQNKNLKIADIGTAIGSFPFYLSQRYKSFDITGFEYLNELINEGKKEYPNIKLEFLDVNDTEAIKKDTFDAISMIGVLSIFDDYELPLKNCIKWLKTGGKLYIFGMFNDYDLDIFLGYKHSNQQHRSELEGGWNIISKTSMNTSLNNLDVSHFEYFDFEMSKDLLKNPDDHARSWTEKYHDGSRFVTNGLCLLQPQSLLVITK